MRELSNRFRGARAVSMRREPVPAAYRVFFRHIGLDPDVVRTPIEAAVLERMLRGGFLTGGLLEDVLLIALADTGVPVWALDSRGTRRPAGDPPERRGRAAGARRATAPLLPAGGWSWPTPRRRWRCSSASCIRGRTAPHAGAARSDPVRGSGRRACRRCIAEEALWSCRSALRSALTRATATAGAVRIALLRAFREGGVTEYEQQLVDRRGASSRPRAKRTPAAAGPPAERSRAAPR